MSRILVAVDFSLASHKALEYALKMMNKKEDKLMVFHVYSLPIPDPEMPVQLLSQLGDSYREIAETHIQKLLERIQLEHGGDLDVEAKTVPGMPVEAILDQSESMDADLIVMGMRGKNKALRKILGTTATRVIQNTQSPVVVVPESASYAPVKKIAYASNLEEEDILALDKVINLANGLDAQVHCVHIQREGEQLDIYKKSLLEEAYQYDLVNSPIRVDVVANDDIIAGLNAYVKYKEIDLIVMLTHHRGIFNRIIAGSRTWDMAFQSKVPLWVFQADSRKLKNVSKKTRVKAE
ncbi:MAG: universal stress protein [Bacteroidota bacterium]